MSVRYPLTIEQQRAVRKVVSASAKVTEARNRRDAEIVAALNGAGLTAMRLADEIADHGITLGRTRLADIAREVRQVAS